MTIARPSLRINQRNPNHHLFRNNRRNWWLHYTLHLPNLTVERVRLSLGTADINLARQQRDKCIAYLQRDGTGGLLSADLAAIVAEGRAA